MRNYVARWTQEGRGRKAGQYATQGMGYGPQGNTEDINSAYVFNTRMNRSRAPHLMTQDQLQNWGVEVVYVSLTENPNV
jgi:hypothetical protein